MRYVFVMLFFVRVTWCQRGSVSTAPMGRVMATARKATKMKANTNMM